jgi:DNA-binding response OmpR family regulator
MSADRARVLLVDDESDITLVIKKGLEANGFVVDAFNDPLKALAEYRKGCYDIHVLDIRMPSMSGFELAREIWNINSEAKVCFFTAFEIYEPEAKRVFPNLKSYCFLKKPITGKALAEHLRTHMIQA